MTVAIPNTEVVEGELVPMSFEAFQRVAAEAINDLENSNELLQERLFDMYNAADNVGWQLIGPPGDNHGPRLEQIQNMATRCREMVAGSPLALQGVLVRAGYIWGTGVNINAVSKKGTASQKSSGIPTIRTANQRSLFSVRAQIELETMAATDGNGVFVLNKTTKTAVWIPMQQIGAVAVDQDDPSRINYYRRAWTVTVTNRDGTTETQRRVQWYPAWDYDGPKTRFAEGVAAPNYAMIHISFNTQKGWLWGLPDLLTPSFWINAYKEYLEAGFSVTRALAKLALKTVSPNTKAMNRAAAKIATTTPTLPGQAYGQTASMSPGTDVSAINKSGAEFDFESGDALAGMIAMALGIDVSTLLAKEKTEGDVQISQAVVRRMIGRQGLWDDFLTSVCTYFGVANVDVKFPPVRSVAVHRAIQAVAVAATTNTLHPEEVRPLVGMLMAEYGLELDPSKSIPDPGAWALFVDSPAGADQAGADQPAGGDPNHPGTKPLNTPQGAAKGANDGKKTAAGPLADGDNEQRASKK